MEQRTIQFPRGRLTCTVRGGLAELYLEVRPDRPGLYRGLLKGPRGQVDLGLLLPEGGCLRLGRTVPVADLERKGCWPVTGAEAVLAHAFRQGGPSLPGWQRVRDPAARFPGDPVLARAAAEEDRWSKVFVVLLSLAYAAGVLKLNGIHAGDITSQFSTLLKDHTALVATAGASLVLAILTLLLIGRNSASGDYGSRARGKCLDVLEEPPGRFAGALYGVLEGNAEPAVTA